MRYRILFAVILGLSFLIMSALSLYPREQPETLPLVPMMQQLLKDVQQVDRGIYMEDYSIIKEGAARISDHPVMTPDDKELIKSTLGAEMQDFVEFDMIVHHHADSMRMAAGYKKMQEVLYHYRIVQSGCVDCHSNFRDQIMSARLEQSE